MKEKSKAKKIRSLLRRSEKESEKKTARRTLYLFAAELDVRRYFVRNTFARRQFRKVSPGLAQTSGRALLFQDEVP